MGVEPLSPASIKSLSQKTGGLARYKQTMLLMSLFSVCFGLALTSGLYYYLVPHDINWNASQMILVIHLLVGMLAFITIAPFIFIHQHAVEGRRLFFVIPWIAFRRREKESSWRQGKRVWGYLLTWSLLALGLSGFLLTLPGILWYFEIVWLPGYRIPWTLALVHLGAALLTVGLLWAHLRKLRMRGSSS
ncbi:MAG: hypothetical protein HY866_18175 [Chloroflexi bacterium]|nr:hypothetical protein [Chloroflexota bacterium]